MLPEIREMLKKDGFYLLTNDRIPNGVVPIFVNGGHCFSMRIDEELNPENFYPGNHIDGPHKGKEPISSSQHELN